MEMAITKLVIASEIPIILMLNACWPKTYLIKVVETKKKSVKTRRTNVISVVLMKPNLMHQLGPRYQLTDT